uniref:ATP-binding cassette domain-containing protein n=1 Tax=Ningiella ruwaisensis TaxID=2364274 RepID=UPI00109F6AD0|nr:ABC transporter ATP-binding protein [Ningiella ruwaisensis]
MYSVQSLTVKAAEKTLLHNINVEFKRGAINVILGANGAGKSTLFKALLGEISSHEGRVYFNRKAHSAWSIESLAHARAYVAQMHQHAFDLPVFEYLLLAREHIVESSKQSQQCVEAISHQTGAKALLAQNLSLLSGGEAQLVEFTRAILQLFEAHKGFVNKCLLLDEPASALDIKQTRALYRQIRWFTQSGGTAILIDHDINAMASIAQYILLMKHGRLTAFGSTEEVFTQENLNHCFDVHGEIVEHRASSIFSLPVQDDYVQYVNR